MYCASIPPADSDPVNQAERLAVLQSLALLDTPPEAEFDALVDLARQIFDCPIALISIVDERRQWFKARRGLDVSETPRDQAFCAHAIRRRDIMVVPDATRDVRFHDNPLVTGAPHIRFYAGVPIHAERADGERFALGTLCIIDNRPREFGDAEAARLTSLARLAEALIRGRSSVADALRKAEALNETALHLGRKHRQLVQAERMAGIGSWRVALGDSKLEWSDQVFAIHDLPVGHLPDLARATEFFPPHARAPLSAAMAHTIETGKPFDVELDFISATGREKRVRSIGELERVGGEAVALIGVFQDVTQQYRVQQGLRRSAHQDALTGIANRAGFDVVLDEAVARYEPAGQPLALMLIDLDGFKQVNDVHGHLAGDELLQGVARRLEMPYLNGCLAARLGGDEFALIVPRAADRDVLRDLGERVVTALQRPIDIGAGSVAVGGTIGVCAMAPGMTRRELVHRADLALYEGKRAGKGVVRLWSPPTPYTGPDRRVANRRATD